MKQDNAQEITQQKFAGDWGDGGGWANEEDSGADGSCRGVWVIYSGVDGVYGRAVLGGGEQGTQKGRVGCWVAGGDVYSSAAGRWDLQR